MTPENRYNWIRLGHVLFLDLSKGQVKKIGWSYIGPAVKDKGYF